MHLPRSVLRLLPSALLLAPLLVSAQVIQIRDAQTATGEQSIQTKDTLPRVQLEHVKPGEVSLLPGLFRERRELTKGYVLRLKTEDLLQNHLLEAGVRSEKPIEQMYLGWESPQCQLRGHFAGHWLSAAATFAASDHDKILASRADELVQGLKRCQDLNGGQWVGSIPEKYFSILAKGKVWIWSPQYTLHKTMMGLYDAYAELGDKEALTIACNSADWFLAWTDKQLAEGHSEAIYGGECAGMLELWANLYSATKDPRFLTLASRYSMPDMFRQLLAGGDPLSNAHANASIPWIQGAARLYEVSGDSRYREIVERFWRQAVEERGMFATTGSNAGEFWIPKGRHERFIGNRTQEHCTVYNMIRVAQYLLKWTGEAKYADYIERALYNGILAQQNPSTGMVCYFLPLQPGAKKVWGSETHDFWCCHGTLIQAQAMFEDLIYYRSVDGISVGQFIPSQAVFTIAGQSVRIAQTLEGSTEASNSSRSGDTTQVAVQLVLSADQESSWTLRLRQPAWALGVATVTIDGEVTPVVVSKTGFIELPRVWKNAQVKVVFSKRIVREVLPGEGKRFALVDGPVVLAALGDKESELAEDDQIVPQYEHQYVDGREWQSSHYLVRTRQGTTTLKPLYEVADEQYSVYFFSAPGGRNSTGTK